MTGTAKRVKKDEPEWPPAMLGFSDRLVWARKRIQMPQVKLAELAGVDQGSLSKLENGHRAGATIGTLTSLAGPLGVKQGWLLFGEGDLPEAPPPKPGATDRRKRKTKPA